MGKQSGLSLRVSPLSPSIGLRLPPYFFYFFYTKNHSATLYYVLLLYFRITRVQRKGHAIFFRGKIR